MPDNIDREELYNTDEFQVKLQHYKRKGMNHGRATMIAEIEMLAERKVKVVADDTVKITKKTKKKRVSKNASK